MKQFILNIINFFKWLWICHYKKEHRYITVKLSKNGKPIRRDCIFCSRREQRVNKEWDLVDGPDTRPLIPYKGKLTNNASGADLSATRSD